MQTLILPGYSEKNKEWVDETAKNLKIEGIIRPFYWAHWRDESIKFDFQEKADLIAKHIKGDKINIIAKSAGILVASLLVKAIPDQINKVIFCGIAFRDMETEGLEIVKEAIRLLESRFLGLQNVNDPHGSFDEVKSFGNIKMTGRNDHDYPFFEEFNKFLIN